MPAGSTDKPSLPTAVIPFSDALAFFLAIVAIVWVRRALWISRLRTTNPPLEPLEPTARFYPKVSVIVPARDEEKNIGHCLNLLLRQNYPDYEIIVVDDRSSDRTGEIAAASARLASVPVKILRIEKLPPGWTGKNHAVFAGSKASEGAWLLFTDADTSHAPQSLLTAVTTAMDRSIDLLTLAPETTSRSFWEKTVQPLAVSSLALWFNASAGGARDKSTVLANGQFLLTKRAIYEQTGGNEAVKSEVVEDVELANRYRDLGLNVAFLNGTRLYATRMYTSLAEIHRGWTRILTHLFRKSIPALLHKALLYTAFSILPFAVFLWETAARLVHWPHGTDPLWAIAMAISILIVMVRAVGNRMVRTPARYALLHPLGSLVMVWILFSCVIRVAFNRPSLWRGDRLR